MVTSGEKTWSRVCSRAASQGQSREPRRKVHLALLPSSILVRMVKESKFLSLPLINYCNKEMQAWEEVRFHEKQMNRNCHKAMKTAKTKRTYLLIQEATNYPMPKIKVVNLSLFRQVKRLNSKIKETRRNLTFHLWSKRSLSVILKCQQIRLFRIWIMKPRIKPSPLTTIRSKWTNKMLGVTA